MKTLEEIKGREIFISHKDVKRTLSEKGFTRQKNEIGLYSWKKYFKTDDYYRRVWSINVPYLEILTNIAKLEKIKNNTPIKIHYAYVENHQVKRIIKTTTFDKFYIYLVRNRLCSESVLKVLEEL